MPNTIPATYFETLENFVQAIQQQAAVLPAPAATIAQQLLANVTGAIQSVANNPELCNLPPLTMENGQLTATITSPAQATAETLFQTQVLSRIFAGLTPLAGILTAAMQQTNVWNNAWLTAYQSAQGQSINLAPFQQPGQAEGFAMDLF